VSEGQSGRFLFVFLACLAVIIITGGMIAWSRYEPGEPLDIYRTNEKTWDGTVYVGGAVNLPGYYPFTYEDSVDSLIRAAGGVAGDSGAVEIILLSDESGEEVQPQKIDINRAEIWLLEALPGIGETLALRIAEYRTRNGPFHNTRELMLVEGIGSSIYEEIEHLVTVSE
jgi:competence protein ComEA